MQDTSEFIKSVLSSAGVSAALIAAVAWLLRSWIAERLSAGVRHDYERRMAELNAQLKSQGEASTTLLKADVDRLSERLRTSAQSYAAMLEASAERRLAAVEEIWLAVTVAEVAMPYAFVTLDVLLDSEYESVLTNPKTVASFTSIDHFNLISGVLSRSEAVVKRRPFVGQYLWALFSTYRAILFRMIYLVSQSQSDPKRIHWYADKLVRKHIRAALGDSQLSDFEVVKVGRVTWVRDAFQRAILDAMDAVIAGREAGEAALRQAERMEKLLAEANTAK